MSTSYSNWMNFMDNNGLFKMYYCSVCKKANARMLSRFVFENDGRYNHKEYKIKCLKCGKESEVLRKKNLVEGNWNGLMNNRD